MSPELQLQLAQLMNAVATVVALVLGYQGRQKAKVNRILVAKLQQNDAEDTPAPEPVTVTGMIRVLRYMDYLSRKESERRERSATADQRRGTEGPGGRRSAGAGGDRGQSAAGQ